MGGADIMRVVRARRFILPIACALAGAGVAGVFAFRLAGAPTQGDLAVEAVAGVPAAAGALCVAVGALMYVLQRRVRVGSTPSCRRCGYPYPETERLVTACCECGAPWRWYGGLVRGTPLHPEGVRRAGVALMPAGLAMLLIAMTPTSRVASIAPTGVVVERLAAAPDVQAGVWWDELERRTLPAPVREALALRLLDKRLRAGPVGERADAWLRGTVARLPASSLAVARYAREVVGGSPVASPALAPGVPPLPVSRVLLTVPAHTPARPAHPDATTWTADEMLAPLLSGGAVAESAPAPASIPAWRTPMPADMRRDGWLDQLLGEGDAASAWTIGLDGASGGGEIPPPHLSWNEVRDRINARRASDAMLSPRVRFAPGGGVTAWTPPPAY